MPNNTGNFSAPLKPTVHIIGGGLAGSEAAWQILARGLRVVLHEMRPRKMTAAHQTGDLAELVCSNTFKSQTPDSAPGLLKSEMRAFNSLILRAATESAIPAGQALGVDRILFARRVTESLAQHPHFTRVDEEVITIPSADELTRQNSVWIVASGPLTSPGLAEALAKLAGRDERLFFYDAIAPIIDASTIDLDHCFRQSRYEYDQGTTDGSGDYLNIPLSKDEYYQFVQAISASQKMPLHNFEAPKYFESCLPVEVMVERGVDTLRFGPMKPVGLTDPKTGRWPYAAIQLRQENVQGSMYSMVGFQTKMKWPEQERVFRSLPALRSAEFFRFGSVHRNTYLESPKVLNENLSFRNNVRVFLAGQITGVEGYSESAAMGLIAGQAASATLLNTTLNLPPSSSMIGALLHYVTRGCQGAFQPMNANFGLLNLAPRQRGEGRSDFRKRQCNLSRNSFDQFMQAH